MLKEQIDSDLKAAMTAKEQIKVDAIRMLKARIKNEEIAKQKEFGDAELQDVIASEVKRRKDSVELYNQGNRPELAAKEQEEISILSKYLPEQLSEDEVKKLVGETLAGQNLSAADFGRAMGMVMPKLKGKASGDVVSKVLKDILK